MPIPFLILQGNDHAFINGYQYQYSVIKQSEVLKQDQ